MNNNHLVYNKKYKKFLGRCLTMKIFWRWVQRQEGPLIYLKNLVKAISSTRRDVTDLFVPFILLQFIRADSTEFRHVSQLHSNHRSFQPITYSL